MDQETEMANSTNPGHGGPTPEADAEVGKPSDAAPERDFGDSAGYGTGGSALDYHEVGDAGASDTSNKRNPLDDVMKRPGDAARS
jgi:hypothetical protein